MSIISTLPIRQWDVSSPVYSAYLTKYLNKTEVVPIGYVCWVYGGNLWDLGMVAETLSGSIVQDLPDSKVHGANMGPSGADSTQVGPMLAPWALLFGLVTNDVWFSE